MSAKNPYIQKYAKIKTRGVLCSNLLLLIFSWPGTYTKSETVHRFIESKKWINIMHVCNLVTYKVLYYTGTFFWDFGLNYFYQKAWYK